MFAVMCPVPWACPARRRRTIGWDSDPGDALVLCTDALTGSRRADGELFGDEILPDVLVDCAGQSPNAIAGRLLAAAAEFGGDRLRDHGVVVVVRVPEAIRNEGADWVSRSTGTPLDQLRAPGLPGWRGATRPLAPAYQPPECGVAAAGPGTAQHSGSAAAAPATALQLAHGRGQRG